MNDFLISVGAGIFLSVTSWLLFRILTPFFSAWWYHAPKLSGQWSFFDSEDKVVAVGAAILRQRGNRIVADVTRTTSRSGKTLSRTFKYVGRVRDGQLLLSFEEPVSNGFVAGNLVLKLSGDLKVLSGYTVYLDRDAGVVVAHPIWFRKT